MRHAPEKAISGKSGDILGREGFINRLSKALIHGKQATGVVIGLTGPWGAGKSSILNLLHEKIIEDHGDKSVVVRFDPWLITTKHDLVNQFFAELVSCINNCPEVRRLGNYQFDLPKDLLEYAGAIAPMLDNFAPGISVVAKPSIDLISRAIERDKSIYILKENIEKELRRISYPLVIMIDELDRVEDDEVRLVAQLIKGIADFSNMSYIVAYDETRVLEALGSAPYEQSTEERLDRGRGYIEKIIQYPIPLPVLMDFDLKGILKSDLENVLGDKFSSSLSEKWNNTEERFSQMIHDIVPKLISTPRDIKRLVGHFQILHGLTEEKVDWIDILGVSALQTKAPLTYHHSDLVCFASGLQKYRLGPETIL